MESEREGVPLITVLPPSFAREAGGQIVLGIRKRRIIEISGWKIGDSPKSEMFPGVGFFVDQDHRLRPVEWSQAEVKLPISESAGLIAIHGFRRKLGDRNISRTTRTNVSDGCFDIGEAEMIETIARVNEFALRQLGSCQIDYLETAHLGGVFFFGCPRSARQQYPRRCKGFQDPRASSN